MRRAATWSERSWLCWPYPQPGRLRGTGPFVGDERFALQTVPSHWGTMNPVETPSLKAYEWEPITDLPEDWPNLHRRELELAGAQWMKEKSILRDPGRLRELQEKLATR